MPGLDLRSGYGSANVNTKGIKSHGLRVAAGSTSSTGVRGRVDINDSSVGNDSQPK